VIATVVKVSQTVIKNTGMFADPRNSLQIGLYKLVQVKLIGSDRSCNLLQIFQKIERPYTLYLTVAGIISTCRSIAAGAKLSAGVLVATTSFLHMVGIAATLYQEPSPNHRCFCHARDDTEVWSFSVTFLPSQQSTERADEGSH